MLLIPFDSNPKVQIVAVEGGALQLLIRLLSVEPATSTHVRARMLYALSSLTRHFPFAQARFVQLGGLQVGFSCFCFLNTSFILSAFRNGVPAVWFRSCLL